MADLDTVVQYDPVPKTKWVIVTTSVDISIEATAKQSSLGNTTVVTSAACKKQTSPTLSLPCSAQIWALFPPASLLWQPRDPESVINFNLGSSMSKTWARALLYAVLGLLAGFTVGNLSMPAVDFTISKISNLLALPDKQRLA
ncbi:hypothetical protein BKA67DRAFT_541758 [Truncatella angustata]|uniref:Uncharacterized protein n=1 Tax=Truncatella angustata TaxID=152316 RepID=A0A9P8RGF9_9PEZI|nr:uncharacterized protein BKA67DRAFT_541758 [Truncatella angustata]KAH6645548.1 hypothetical protein BKA67DRAFT_541758 [Truncatella angustata]